MLECTLLFYSPISYSPRVPSTTQYRKLSFLRLTTSNARRGWWVCRLTPRKAIFHRENVNCRSLCAQCHWVPCGYRNNTLIIRRSELLTWRTRSCSPSWILCFCSCIFFASGHFPETRLFQSELHYPEKRNCDCLCFSETITFHKN